MFVSKTYVIYESEINFSKISEENFDYCSTLDFNRDMDSHQMRMYSSEPKLGQKGRNKISKTSTIFLFKIALSS